MSAFLELVAAATPGPWASEPHPADCTHHIFGPPPALRFVAECSRQSRLGTLENDANAQLIARCSPDTMKRVYEALKEAKGLAEIVGPGEDEDIATVHGLEQHVAQITEALALLDGQPDAQGGGR